MTTVLVVDDNEENRYLLQSMLQGSGYAVVAVANGDEALAIARQSAPDIVISDILMPGMDGFSLCREWKGDPRFTRIPFVFYTATYTHPKDEELALSLGADRFIIKPAEPESFLSMIAEVLALQQAGGLGRSTTGPTSAPVTEAVYLKQYNEALVRKLEKKLIDLEELNKELMIKDWAIASSISGVAITDLAERITYMNQAMARMWELDASATTPGTLDDLFREDRQIQRLRAALREKGNWFGEIQARRRDGSPFVAQCIVHEVRDHAARPLCIMISCVEVTEQRRMAEELRRTQKLESLALFAAGIAHDFNNLLTGLYGNIQMAQMTIDTPNTARQYLDTSMDVFERARDLTQRLLTFAKGCPSVKKSIQIGELLRECSLLSLSGSNIRCETHVDRDIWLVEGDANQFSQVFSNLLINARQAMPDGGTVVVQAVNRSVESSQVGQLSAGKYVMISVKDEGVGIPKELLHRIFDPFFTVKKQGTGLGLATSHSIVRSHGGHIEVTSTPGVGSTFSVWLPASVEAKRDEARAEGPREISRHTGRILVMDDEITVCQTLSQMLSLGGYEVTTACSGEEALVRLRQAEAAATPFNLVILDLTVRGGMGGRQALAELRKIDPGIAVIVSSGYGEELRSAEAEGPGAVAALPKPYSLDELLCSVRAAIARNETPGAHPVG